MSGGLQPDSSCHPFSEIHCLMYQQLKAARKWNQSVLHTDFAVSLEKILPQTVYSLQQLLTFLMLNVGLLIGCDIAHGIPELLPQRLDQDLKRQA